MRVRKLLRREFGPKSEKWIVSSIMNSFVQTARYSGHLRQP